MHFRDFEHSPHSGKHVISFCSILVLLVKVLLLNDLAQHRFPSLFSILKKNQQYWEITYFLVKISLSRTKKNQDQTKSKIKDEGHFSNNLFSRCLILTSFKHCLTPKKSHYSIIYYWEIHEISWILSCFNLKKKQP